ncbi:MAG: rhodanese-like domain-containing protein [Methylotenera sp.]|nr:rhodanese-like domain-containing protein [Methylotenera sp.]
MNTFHEINAQELFELLSKQPVLLVDVRNQDEVMRGKIPSAIHIPLAMLPVEYEPLKKVENLVFYCHSGIRSAHAAAFAVSKGCHNVFNLVGGVLAWEKAKFEFETQEDKVTQNAFS